MNETKTVSNEVDSSASPEAVIHSNYLFLQILKARQGMRVPSLGRPLLLIYYHHGKPTERAHILLGSHELTVRL